MLARPQCFAGHGKVVRVGGADVNRVDFRIAENIAIVGRNRGHGKSCTQASRRLRISADDSGGLDKFQPPHRLEMHAPHKASTDDRRPDYFHCVPALDPPGSGRLLTDHDAIEKIRSFRQTLLR
jgi:hypothetical protein